MWCSCLLGVNFSKAGRERPVVLALWMSSCTPDLTAIDLTCIFEHSASACAKVDYPGL